MVLVLMRLKSLHVPFGKSVVTHSAAILDFYANLIEVVERKAVGTSSVFISSLAENSRRKSSLGFLFRC